MEGERKETPDIDIDPKLEGASEKMKFKDWISIAFSLLALMVAVGSAYWNIVREVDKLSIAITGDNPRASINAKTRHLVVSDNNTIAFMNSGTRAIAVTSSNLRLELPRGMLK
jgi:hypothetical protein